jgi:glycosyltransferase involved in cell wall biosynthesis
VVRHAQHFPDVAERTRAIPIACDPAFRAEGRPWDLGALATEFGLRRPYVLYAGSFAARKNLALLLRAWGEVSAQEPGLQLVLAGRPSGRDDTPLDDARRRGVKIVERRKTIGEMRALYAGAEMLVFPSRYEGFGLPALEAMSCGCPVIAAAATSLPEIVGDAGVLVDPDDARGLAREMLGVLRDPARRSWMREAGLARSRLFDWTDVARKTLEGYRDAVR